MSDEPVDINEEDNSEDDWENRTLCSDESCIGVIGPDGRCKECGREHEQKQGESDSTIQSDSPPAEDTDEAANKDPSPAFDSDDWENRTLCSDESCIGVIGPGGLCKECGKPYAG
jgi:hypothetical protein